MSEAPTKISEADNDAKVANIQEKLVDYSKWKNLQTDSDEEEEVDEEEKDEAYDKFLGDAKRWTAEDRQNYIDGLDDVALLKSQEELDAQGGDMTTEAMKALLEEGEDDRSLALHFKEKGNESYAKGRKVRKEQKRIGYYRHALTHYDKAYSYVTEAVRPPNKVSKKLAKLHSTILSNRAQVHIELRNYGSCRRDCVKAIMAWRKNVKAYFRAAKASWEVRKYLEGLEFAVQGLKVDPENKSLVEVHAKLAKKKVELDAKEAKQKKDLQQLDFKVTKVMKACEKRNLRMGPAIFIEQYKDYEGAPSVEANGTMTWPCIFLYDEYQQSDFVQAFNEGEMFCEHLGAMFPIDGPFAPWDSREDYQAPDVDVFFQENVVQPFASKSAWRKYFAKGEGVILEDGWEDDETPEERRKRYANDTEKNAWVRVPVEQGAALFHAVTHKGCVVPAVPTFHVFVKKSKFFEDWKKGKKIVELPVVHK